MAEFAAAILLFLMIFKTSACEILEVLPNPYGDDGREYVKVECSQNCTLTDHESTFNLSKGVHYIANNKTAFRQYYGFEPDFDGIRLSNSGEEVVLLCDSKAISFDWSEEYRDPGVVYFKTENGWDFRYEDWSSFKPESDFVKGRIIITPAKYVLEGEGIVASYTVTRDSFRGDFEFIVDASPVGGLPSEEIALAKKYRFHFLEGSYRNFHYKFAVVGNRTVITTENWKWDNRGIIVELYSSKFSRFLEKVFRNDLKYETKPGRVSDVEGDYSEGKGKELQFEGYVELHVLPDSNPVFDFIESSEGFLYIAVPYIDFEWFSDESPLLNAIINASEKHEVRVMLNDYDRNREVVEFLNSIPNVSARIVRSPEFDELHGKYLITEGKVLVTSANFNKYGLKLNREIAVVIESQDVSEFMKEVFEGDWERRAEISPIVSLSLLGFTFLIAFYFVRRSI
ncbi:hypothetical protein GACE_2008 [Geoglobus acetivorans]|uniref:Phospholipase D-like domain-containing protein n=1 Tax=Geoglobus acetivorans TaxID=565033 RepID=A0A0A7GJ97_GEOAI|nr:hypothetical protein GACE_2008 [Geoglobus acetivorans]